MGMHLLLGPMFLAGVAMGPSHPAGGFSLLAHRMEIASNDTSWSGDMLEVCDDEPMQIDMGSGTPIVALRQANLGGQSLLLMPDGWLDWYGNKFLSPTEAPFVPDSPRTIAERYREWMGPAYRIRCSQRRVCVYNCSERFRIRALAVMDVVEEGVYRYFADRHFPVHRPRFPLVVILFGTHREFVEFTKAEPGIAGLYSGWGNFTVASEWSAFWNEEQMLQTVAHEAVHQTLANIGIEHRLARWPAWVSEGIAECLSQVSAAEHPVWLGPTPPPRDRARYLQANAGGPRREPAMGRTAKLERLENGLQYVVSWGMVHYLLERRPNSFRLYLRSLRSRGPFYTPLELLAEDEWPEDFSPIVGEAKVFRRYFGATPRQLEEEFRVHLTALSR